MMADITDLFDPTIKALDLLEGRPNFHMDLRFFNDVQHLHIADVLVKLLYHHRWLF